MSSFSSLYFEIKSIFFCFSSSNRCSKISTSSANRPLRLSIFSTSFSFASNSAKDCFKVSNAATLKSISDCKSSHFCSHSVFSDCAMLSSCVRSVNASFKDSIFISISPPPFTLSFNVSTSSSADSRASARVAHACESSETFSSCSLYSFASFESSAFFADIESANSCCN